MLNERTKFRTPTPELVPRTSATHGREVRFGLVHYATFPESLIDDDTFRRTLKNAVEAGAWDVIELSTEIPQAWISSARDADLLLPATLFFSAGPEMLRWRDALNSASTQSRRRAVSRVRELVERAAASGAENLMLVSGPVAGGATSWGPLLESLHQVCEYAATFGVRAPGISVETFETLAIQRQYVGPTPLALWLMETLRRDYAGFRITLDLAHILQLGEELAESLAAARGQVRHLQLSCCVLRPGDPRWGDQHLPFGSRESHPTFAEVSRALAAWSAAFAEDDAQTAPPVVSMEVRPPRGEDSTAVHLQCARDVARICAGAGLNSSSGRTEATQQR